MHRPCKLTFDLLILKVVSESRVMWRTSVPILVFLDLCVLNLGPMNATDRVVQASTLQFRQWMTTEIQNPCHHQSTPICSQKQQNPD